MNDLLARAIAVLNEALPTARSSTYTRGCVVLRDLEQAVAGQQRDHFQIGDTVRKLKGAQWQGKVVGAYSTSLTPEGYCVESDAHPGSVQIYPAAALELVP